MDFLMSEYHIFYVKVDSITPLEGYIQSRADQLFEEVCNSGIWTTPIVIDNKHGLIMDGHHRHQVAMRLGLTFVPAVACSYSEVNVWSLRESEVVSVERILQNYKEGIIYPNKTAKHDLPFTITSNLEIRIDELK